MLLEQRVHEQVPHDAAQEHKESNNRQRGKQPFFSPQPAKSAKTCGKKRQADGDQEIASVKQPLVEVVETVGKRIGHLEGQSHLEKECRNNQGNDEGREAPTGAVCPLGVRRLNLPFLF